MNKMREVPTSNTEHEFVVQALENNLRIDGRGPYDNREIKIAFGLDYGCCLVTYGHTRVLAQVSCELAAPKATRPSEGLLHINLELTTMAAAHFEAGRYPDLGVELTRLLEKGIRDSRCIDMESLCIVAGEKVWDIALDIRVLNHDGNLVGASFLAGISALAHFRHPDVTVSGEDVVINSVLECDPVPLVIHHYPLCVSFAFFSQGKYMILDPIDLEERVSEGKVVVGVNAHQEICTLNLVGSMLLVRDQVLRCAEIASKRVVEMTDIIKKALEKDSEQRKNGEVVGFASLLEKDSVLAAQKVVPLSSSFPEDEITESREMEEVEEKMKPFNLEDDLKVIYQGPKTVLVGEGGPSKWGVVDVEDSDEESDSKEMVQKTIKKSALLKDEVKAEDSEEEEISMLTGETVISEKRSPSPEELDLTKALKSDSQKSRGWYNKSAFL